MNEGKPAAAGRRWRLVVVLSVKGYCAGILCYGTRPADNNCLCASSDSIPKTPCLAHIGNNQVMQPPHWRKDVLMLILDRAAASFDQTKVESPRRGLRANPFRSAQTW